MTRLIDHDAVAALADEPLDWRFKGLPSQWWGRTPAQLGADRPDLFADGAVGPVCVLRASALTHNLTTMARWCRERGVELAPHGKTHMAPQLLARQLDAGAVAITAATIAQVRVFRAFGVRDIILANELVDAAGLAWLAAEMAVDPGFGFVCWVDSVRGVELMAAALTDAARPVDVCVEVGMAHGRTGCRTPEEVDAVAAAAAANPRLRLVGVAGYEAACGQEVTADALAAVDGYLADLQAAVVRLAATVETDRVLVTAGGSTYFDRVTRALTDWPDGPDVRTVLRSGCYLTHDDGLYDRTSPLSAKLLPALSVWSQVISRPEPGLAMVALGRRDISFDQGMPVPRSVPGARVTRLHDQHAFVELTGADIRQTVAVGDWLEFGLSHPCTTFDKWQLIPVLDDDGRVVELIRTFF
ncbi:alanine racemase [Mycolicibacterium sp. F2034L]|uniref:alanine racemase n=1 Tax=Mycolicibacterium sp. F2034L TaxID=2926422 RepID=UPI001FF37657|nr:alanine racemase [Mycolicibacterium sp. F2034L]MCK0176907.1 alanine racemase [Mycolicibacterium sp. F2034L]